MPTREPVGPGGPMPSDVVARSADFTGRGWAMRKIAAWLRTSASPLLLITAGPGCGKTALAERLLQVSAGAVPVDGVNRTDCRIDAANFCDQRTFASVDPVRVLERLGEQLAENVPGYGAQLLTEAGRSTGDISVRQQVRALPGAVVSVQAVVINFGDRNPRRAYDEIIRRPLTRLYEQHGRRVVLLVDALNEAEAAASSLGVMSLGALLGVEAEDPVPGLRMILTSSRGRVEQELGAVRRFDLVTDEPEDSSDVYDYTRARLTGRVAQAEDLAQRIARVDGGNFLYARYVIDDILSGRIPADRAGHETLPADLAHIYAGFLQRERNRGPARWSEQMRPVLAALTLGRGEGLTREQIARATDLRVSTVDDTLRVCARYLQGAFPHGPFRPFHASFTTYLLTNTDQDLYAAEAGVDLVEGLVRPWVRRWEECDALTLRHAVEHMVEAIALQSAGRARDDLVRLLVDTLQDPAYLVAMAARHGVESLLVAVEQAARVTPELSRTLDPLQSVLSRQLGVLLELDKDSGTFLSQIQLEAAAQGETALVEAIDFFRTGRAWRGLRVLGGTTSESPLYRLSLVGHTEDLTAVAVTDDSRHAITTSWDRTARVWDLLTGRQLSALEHRGVPWHVTAGNRFAVTAADEDAVRLWDIASGMLRHEFDPALPAHARVLRLDESRGRLTTGWSDGHIRIWDIHTGDVLYDCVPTAKGRRDPDPAVTALDVDWDRGRLVHGTNGGTVTLWELGKKGARRDRQFRLEGMYTAHSWEVEECLLHPDGRRIITAGSFDHCIRVWDPQRKRPVVELRGDMFSLAALRLIDDGRTALSISTAGTVEAWDLDTYERSAFITTSRRGEHIEFHELCAWAITPDDDHVLVGFADGRLAVVDIHRQAVIEVLETSPRRYSRLCGVAVTKDGLRAVTASADQDARVWRLDPQGAGQRAGTPASDAPAPDPGTDTNTTELARNIDFGDVGVTELKATPDGGSLISVAEDAIRVWDTSTGQQRYALFEKDILHRGQACWRTETHERVLTYDHEYGHWYSACPDSFAAFTVGDFMRDLGSYCEHTVHTCADEGTRRNAPVRAMVLPDAHTALAVQLDGAITTWDIDTGSVLGRLQDGPPGMPRLLAAGQTLLAVWPESLRSWNWTSGRPLLALDEQFVPETMAMSSEGHHGIIGTPDGTVLVWRSPDPGDLLQWQAHRSDVTGCAIDEEGTLALTADATGALTAWTLTVRPGEPQALATLSLPAPADWISSLADADLTFTVHTQSESRFTVRATGA
ncbi:hypothetical protein ACFY1J_30925 [Streptomyces sp. NPDC001406]|uniref:hypothetical protein n=1 Tax=Streptomyces sp. NPDC001406 TaxID=3364572 RepID=UPI00369DF610